LTKEQQDEMLTKDAGTYFDWAPNTQDYYSHIDYKPQNDRELTEFIKRLKNDDK
jgi:hypothetical protein